MTTDGRRQLEHVLSAVEDAYIAADEAGLPASNGQGSSEAAVGWDDDLDMGTAVKAPSSAPEE